MSYSCYISFKKMPASEIIPFFRELKEKTTQNLPVIAQHEYAYCPFIRNTVSVERDWESISRSDKNRAVDWAKTSVFSLKYFYDVDAGYLGIFGVPTVMRNMFDGTVYFQNSCDQDYNRTAWAGISWFEEIYDKWMKYTVEYVVQKYFDFYGDDFYKEYSHLTNSPEKMQENLLYYRRTFAYREIWEHFENYLYRSRDVIYCSLYGHCETAEMLSFVRACHAEQIKSEDEFEAEWKAKENKKEGN